MSSKSFSEVEKQAQVVEKLREEQAAEAKKQAEESMYVFFLRICVIAICQI